jgi:hypothetical protein
MPEPEQTELELGAVKKSLENAKIVLETQQKSKFLKKINEIDSYIYDALILNLLILIPAI